MKIVVLDAGKTNPGDLSWEAFGQLGELTVHEATPRELVIERAKDAEVIILNAVPMRKEQLQQCPKLRYIGLLSTGYNQIDIEYAKERGILVANVPEYSTEAVAQHTIALLLQICNQISWQNEQVQQGKWNQETNWRDVLSPLIELKDKTIGMIGFGNIGQAAAKIAIALGMRVLASGSRPTEAGRKLAEYVSLQELYAKADVISLHCPLLPETKGMICAQSIAQMRDGVILLNTARGPLLVEEDVAEALASGKIRAAGIDVVAYEPIVPQNPLLHHPNCYITPHTAWAAHETRERLLDIVLRNLQLFLQGQPVNIINL